MEEKKEKEKPDWLVKERGTAFEGCVQCRLKPPHMPSPFFLLPSLCFSLISTFKVKIKIQQNQKKKKKKEEKPIQKNSIFSIKIHFPEKIEDENERKFHLPLLLSV